MDKLLLTPEEAARALSIGRSKLYELLARGELDSVSIGASRRVPVGALTAYIERLVTTTEVTHRSAGEASTVA